MTSPAFFDDRTSASDDALSEFAGQYNYLYAKALIFDAAQDSFRTVAAMGNVLRGGQLSPLPMMASCKLAGERRMTRTASGGENGPGSGAGARLTSGCNLDEGWPAA